MCRVAGRYCKTLYIGAPSFLINFFKNEFKFKWKWRFKNLDIKVPRNETRLSSHIGWRFWNANTAHSGTQIPITKILGGYEDRSDLFNFNSLFNSLYYSTHQHSRLLQNLPIFQVFQTCRNRSSADYQLHNYTSTFSNYIIIIITLLTMPLLDIVPGWI